MSSSSGSSTCAVFTVRHAPANRNAELVRDVRLRRRELAPLSAGGTAEGAEVFCEVSRAAAAQPPAHPALCGWNV